MDNLQQYAQREAKDVQERVKDKIEQGNSASATLAGQTLHRVDSLLSLLRDNLGGEYNSTEDTIKVQYNGETPIQFIKRVRSIFGWSLKKAKRFSDFAKGDGAFITRAPNEVADLLPKLQKAGAEVKVVKSTPGGGDREF